MNLSRSTSSEIHNAYNSIANSNSSTLLRPRLRNVCHVKLPHKIESDPLDALQWNPLISFYGAKSVGLFLCNSILLCLNTGTDLNVTAAEQVPIQVRARAENNWARLDYSKLLSHGNSSRWDQSPSRPKTPQEQQDQDEFMLVSLLASLGLPWGANILSHQESWTEIIKVLTSLSVSLSKGQKQTFWK